MNKRLFLTAAATTLLASAASSAKAEPKSGYAQVNGMNMYYEVSGQGEPIIVLHGAYMNIPSMGAIIPELAKTRTVYAVEMQSHGRTNDIDRPITYPNLADDIAVFMDAVKLPKADIAGYSLGAVAGLQVAIRHPGKVRKLVMISGAYDYEGWHPDFRAFIPKMTVEMFMNMPFAAEYKKLNPNPDGFAEHARKLIALEKEPMQFGEDVKKMNAPVLIMTGDADAATLEHSVSLFHLLGGGVMGDMGKPLAASRLAVLPATAHTAIITQTDFLFPMITMFLDGQTPKSFFEQ